MSFKHFGITGLSLALLLQCGNPGGTSDETVTTAMLCNPGGSPAAHVKVRFFPVNYNPRTGTLAKTAATADSTSTDANGNYSIALDTGIYNILAAGDSGMVYQDSLKVSKGTMVKPPADTLKPAGSVKGVVQLQPGDDARTVFILFMGTHTFIMPDNAAGDFIAADMAEGKYRVRILTTLDNYEVLDTSISVASGRTDTLPASIVLKFKGIPTPSNFGITYDSLKQLSVLKWNKLDTNRISGYKIYRKVNDSNLVLISSITKKDTVFIDSNSIQGSKYIYRVSAIDTNDQEGPKSSPDTIIATTAFIPTSRIILDSIQQQTDPYQFTLCKDSTIVVTINQQSLYKYNKEGRLIKVFGTGMFTQLIGVVSDDKGSIYALNNSNVLKFSKEGDSISEWRLQNNGFSIYIDSSMNLYLGTSDNQGLRFIEKYDTTGKFQLSTGINSDDLEAVSPAGDLYVRNSNTNTYSVFNSGMLLMDTFAISFQGETVSQMQGVDSKGNRYFSWFMPGSTASSAIFGVYIFDKNRQYIGRWVPTNTMNQYFKVNNNTCYILDRINPIGILVFPIRY